MLEIAIHDRTARPTAELNRLKSAVAEVCRQAGVSAAEISVALVDDAQIAELHQRYLELAEPTDVLSFVLSHDGGRLEGEIVASVDTATRQALRCGWPAADELLLYVVHGALHLVGYDDIDPADRRRMRQAERRILAGFGLDPPATPDEDSGDDTAVATAGAPREAAPRASTAKGCAHGR